MLPFTVDDFFSVFAAYNRAIWPAQVVAYALGLVALAAAWKGGVWGRRVAAIVLGVFWLWNGAIYHFAFFAQINPAAYAFAALFLMQGLLFLCVAGVASDRLFPNPPTAGWRRSVALGLIAYAAVVYELLSHLQGHGWPHAPIFGVAPCPTTIFTIGNPHPAGTSAAHLAYCDTACLGGDRIDGCSVVRCQRGSCVAGCSDTCRRAATRLARAAEDAEPPSWLQI